MLGVVRATKRLVQKGQVQYDPNIFKQLIIKGNGWDHPTEKDESDHIEEEKKIIKTPNKWGGTTITLE
jgi:hypothetical protein